MSEASCICDPRHIEIGGTDPGCPIHKESTTDLRKSSVPG